MPAVVKNVYMITGFLGSGKTTFLNEWLRIFQDHSFALVINEFGSADVDGALFDQTRIDVTKISNGSILCSCRSDRFVETMLNLSKTDVTDVIIETSGLSDMTVLIDMHGVSIDVCHLRSFLKLSCPIARMFL